LKQLGYNNPINTTTGKTMKDFNECADEMNTTIEEAIGGKALVYYSAYKTSKTTGLQLNNLSQQAISGKVILRQQFEDFWGGEGKDYQSHVVTDPTWLDIAVLADVMIHTTNDRHHIFLEGVAPTNEKIGGVKVYEFVMGS